jgi:acyl carrier protein
VRSPDLEALRREVADVARVPVEAVTRETILIDELALDSVGLAELLARLITKYDLVLLDEQMLQHSWDGVTVGELFDTYCPQQFESVGERPSRS